MTLFSIRTSPESVCVTLDEYLTEDDVMGMLAFNEDNLEELLQRHAATQAYWEAYAVRLRNRLQTFRDEWYKKWFARSKVYSKYVLSAYGDSKPTIDAINDMVILIYSQETSDVERQKYCQAAFTVACKAKVGYTGSKEDFEKSMYRDSPPWYFETIQRTVRKLEEDSEIVGVIADKLNSRSFHIQEVLKLVVARRNVVDPCLKDREVMDALSNRKGV